ncbi:nucleosome assembly protein 1;3-like [Papaver somniferum]|uniref:nucleosome assembly protein 1;3-like n=1 Tax=Papaver somniferum TaxID=3469 RepID=UPI000E700A4F|nr:nucleosome assembly protein 1;3-like [Papaver somniferum]
MEDLRASLPDLVKDWHTPSKNKRQCLDVLKMHTPNVRKRVEDLRKIQTEHDEMKAEFFDERAKLEVEFQKKYKPLYDLRFDIVSGRCEVGGEVGNAVPNFWLNAMKANEVLAKVITERDEDALKHLKEIEWESISTPKGFKLSFYFIDNPYFETATLEKTYHVTDDDEPSLQKVIGTEIEWKDGKNLTRQQEKKKRKRQLDDCESFFNFFNSHLVPDDDYDLDKEAFHHS